MCTRISLAVDGETLREAFGVEPPPRWAPRYNVAPSQDVLALVEGRRLRRFRWGLVPPWANSPRTAFVNARAETAARKPAFARAFARRRCLVPADGFYEWRGPKGHRRPYRVTMKDGRPFALAGLWERWEAPDGEALETCAVLTTTPNALLAELHDRMPVVVPPEAYDAWLGADAGEAERLLAPFPPDAMTYYPVGTVVNDSRNDVPACVRPVA